MKGSVVGFDRDRGTGIIRGDDGAQYEFLEAEWRSDTGIRTDMEVEFLPVEGAARQICAVQTQTPVVEESLPAAKQSPLAIISLVCGILSLIAGGVVFQLAAIICGHLARSEIRRSNGAIRGDGMAIAGLILGYIGIAVVLVTMSLVLMAVILGG